MNKSHFIIFEDSSKATFGGGQKVTLEIIKILKKNGYNLLVFDYTDQSIFAKQVKSLNIPLIRLSGRGRIVGGGKQSFSLGLKELLCLPFFLMCNWLQVKKQLNLLISANTILYAATKKSYLIPFFLKLINNQYRLIFHAHSLDSRHHPFFRIFRKFLQKADQIIAVSNVVNKNIALKQTKTVYNPLSLNPHQRKKILIGKKPIVVASVSTLIQLKGINYFIESCKYLTSDILNKLEFHVYGVGNEQENLQRIASCIDRQKIKFKGFIPFQEIANCIDIIVLPSIVPEACPMIVLEANSFGIPVITTNIGGQAELVKHRYNGLLVSPGDAKAIASAIETLIESPELYEQLSHNALMYAQKFDIRFFEQNILTLFKL